MPILEGNTTIYGNLTVSGDFILSSLGLDNLFLANNLNVSGDTHLVGATYLADNFNVSGDTHLVGATYLANNLNVSGATHLVGATYLANNLNVSGDTHLAGNLALTGSLDVSAASIFADLTVSGDIDFTGTLYKNGVRYPPPGGPVFIDASSSQRLTLQSSNSQSTYLLQLHPDSDAIVWTGSNVNTTTYDYGTYIVLPSILSVGSGITYKFIIRNIISTPGTLVFNTSDGALDRFQFRLTKYGSNTPTATPTMDASMTDTYSYTPDISTLRPMDYFEFTSVFINSTTLYWLVTGVIHG